MNHLSSCWPDYSHVFEICEMWQINRFMLCAAWRAANVCLPIWYIYSPSSDLSPIQRSCILRLKSVACNPVMSLQKTAGAHPLICSDSCSEESESMIHPMDKETSRGPFGKITCGRGTLSSKGVLRF